MFPSAELCDGRVRSVEMDAKQRVLMAIYAEYQKDLPDMSNITAETVGLDLPVFCAALEKLENEGYITGVHIRRDVGRVFTVVIMDSVMLTPYGIEYVETHLKIERDMSRVEKAKTILKAAGERGWEELKDFAAKVIAEMMK
jgi:DNA-binding Lrp family transcriptional regulator